MVNVTYHIDPSVTPITPLPTSVPNNQIVTIKFRITNNEDYIRLFGVNNALCVNYRVDVDTTNNYRFVTIEFICYNNNDVAVYLEAGREDERANYIMLYNSTAEVNRLDKRKWLRNPNSTCIVRGNFRNPTNVELVTLTIEYSDDYIFPFNYIMIPAFKRYYFVTDIVNMGNNLWTITCSCDVLMSFREAILNTVAMIDRNEKLFNPLMVDNNLPVSIGVNKTIEFVENTVLNRGLPNPPYVPEGVEGDDLYDYTYNYTLVGQSIKLVPIVGGQ